MFSSLSKRLAVESAGMSPQALLHALLGRLVGELGQDLVGHAKAIAHVEGGMYHASTTGVETGVDVRCVGTPTPSSAGFDIDFMCAFHGMSAKRLATAWDAAVASVAASGPRLIAIEIAPTASVARARSLSPMAGSLLSSLLVLKPCCVLPLLWTLSGSSLAALQVLRPLEAYRPVFITLSVVCLAIAFHRLYVAPLVDASARARKSLRRARGIFCASVLMFVIALSVPALMPDPQHTEHGGAHHSHH